ncbi:unnamed protein product [Amoebophrya sp. A120]|nr:unnamed protein product [Amoebophrya sp. A120]|eukprot:GSA120T00018449001.1
MTPIVFAILLRCGYSLVPPTVEQGPHDQDRMRAGSRAAQSLMQKEQAAVVEIDADSGAASIAITGSNAPSLSDSDPERSRISFPQQLTTSETGTTSLPEAQARGRSRYSRETTTQARTEAGRPEQQRHQLQDDAASDPQAQQVTRSTSPSTPAMGRHSKVERPNSRFLRDEKYQDHGATFDKNREQALKEKEITDGQYDDSGNAVRGTIGIGSTRTSPSTAGVVRTETNPKNYKRPAYVAAPSQQSFSSWDMSNSRSSSGLQTESSTLAEKNWPVCVGKFRPNPYPDSCPNSYWDEASCNGDSKCVWTTKTPVWMFCDSLSAEVDSTTGAPKYDYSIGAMIIVATCAEACTDYFNDCIEFSPDSLHSDLNTAIHDPTKNGCQSSSCQPSRNKWRTDCSSRGTVGDSMVPTLVSNADTECNKYPSSNPTPASNPAPAPPPPAPAPVVYISPTSLHCDQHASSCQDECKSYMSKPCFNFDDPNTEMNVLNFAKNSFCPKFSQDCYCSLAEWAAKSTCTEAIPTRDYHFADPNIATFNSVMQEKVVDKVAQSCKDGGTAFAFSKLPCAWDTTTTTTTPEPLPEDVRTYDGNGVKLCELTTDADGNLYDACICMGRTARVNPFCEHQFYDKSSCTGQEYGFCYWMDGPKSMDLIWNRCHEWHILDQKDSTGQEDYSTSHLQCTQSCLNFYERCYELQEHEIVENLSQQEVKNCYFDPNVPNSDQPKQRRCNSTSEAWKQDCGDAVSPDPANLRGNNPSLITEQANVCHAKYSVAKQMTPRQYCAENVPACPTECEEIISKPCFGSSDPSVKTGALAWHGGENCARLSQDCYCALEKWKSGVCNVNTGEVAHPCVENPQELFDALFGASMLSSIADWLEKKPFCQVHGGFNESATCPESDQYLGPCTVAPPEDLEAGALLNGTGNGTNATNATGEEGSGSWFARIPKAAIMGVCAVAGAGVLGAMAYTVMQGQKTTGNGRTNYDAGSSSDEGGFLGMLA